MLKLKNSPNIATGRVELKQKTKNEHLFIKSLNDNIKITKIRGFLFSIQIFEYAINMVCNNSLKSFLTLKPLHIRFRVLKEVLS